jgi:2-dehydropantoate 2-reductase
VTVHLEEAVEGRAAQLARDGLRVRGHVTLDQPGGDCLGSLAELSGVEGLTAVFLCTKTWALKPLMNEMAAVNWPPAMRVVAFMNGIGPEDAIGDVLGRERVCRGIINYAGNIAADGTVTMNWFHPPNLLGPASDRRPEWIPLLAEILSGAGLGTQEVDFFEMKKAAFFKTILNSALNALCAAHGLTMGEAMRLRHTRSTAKVLIREGLTVAGMVGYHYGEDTLDRCMEYLGAGGEHYPSMWFDLRDRRPTEIDFINGKIVKIARMFRNCDVDLNRYFTSAIITQEIKNKTRDEDDIPDYLVNS